MQCVQSQLATRPTETNLAVVNVGLNIDGGFAGEDFELAQVSLLDEARFSDISQCPKIGEGKRGTGERPVGAEGG